MKPIPNWFKSACLALPLIGYLGAIGLAEARRAGAPRYELRIEGYDPRDLVRGHYLLYRFVTVPAGGQGSSASEEEAQFSGDGQGFSGVEGRAPVEWDHLACVTQAQDGESTIFTFAPNATRPAACETLLPLDFIQAPHRFYVQEDKGLQLEQFVRDGRASVVIVVPNGASPTATALLIDGKPAKDAKPTD